MRKIAVILNNNLKQLWLFSIIVNIANKHDNYSEYKTSAPMSKCFIIMFTRNCWVSAHEQSSKTGPLTSAHLLIMDIP